MSLHGEEMIFRCYHVKNGTSVEKLFNRSYLHNDEQREREREREREKEREKKERKHLFSKRNASAPSVRAGYVRTTHRFISHFVALFEPLMFVKCEH